MRKYMPKEVVFDHEKNCWRYYRVTPKGKWILIPSFGVDLAYDPAADGENTKGVKGKLTNSTTAATHVNAKNLGVVNAVAKLGADIVCTKDLMFSLNATIGVTNKGDQRSYGGGFRWHF